MATSHKWLTTNGYKVHCLSLQGNISVNITGLSVEKVPTMLPEYPCADTGSCFVNIVPAATEDTLSPYQVLMAHGGTGMHDPTSHIHENCQSEMPGNKKYSAF